MVIEVSAPGSLMICGEHAVVYGHRAIVCAIAQLIAVRLSARNDHKLVIYSELADYESDLTNIVDHHALKFVLEAVRQNMPKQGITLTVVSEIDSTLGFGSSAAVTVATVVALLTFNEQSYNFISLHERAHAVVLAVQKRGSGADLAASIYGGMIAYHPPKLLGIQALSLPPQILSIRYAGYKTPTAVVLARIADRALENPKYYDSCYARMGALTEEAIKYAEQKNWTTFYCALNDYQREMEKLGVCDAIQSEHITAANTWANAVKISGSGLGDCIIAYGDNFLSSHHEVDISNEGVRIVNYS